MVTGRRLQVETERIKPKQDGQSGSGRLKRRLAPLVQPRSTSTHMKSAGLQTLAVLCETVHDVGGIGEGVIG